MQKTPGTKRIRNYRSRTKRPFSKSKPKLSLGRSRRARLWLSLQNLGSFFASNTQEVAPDTRSRLFIVWGVLIAAALGLGINLYRLQVVDSAALTKKARNQQMFSMRPFLPRRQIVDRNLDVLAIDRPVYVLYVHPNMFEKSQDEIATQLGTILQKDPHELKAQFAAKNSGIVLASGLSEEIADQISSLRFNGIDLQKKYNRYYPQDDLFADVVGYINADRRGKAGVEITQEKLLERLMQTVRLSRSGNGSMMSDHVPDGFLHSDELRLKLTIDSRLQRVARSALKQQLEHYNAKRGAVIVMDSWDGSLLALVCQPSYNPNKYGVKDIQYFRNWAIADLYEPGSTFKPLNVAIALESGAIQPTDVFNDTGKIVVADRLIQNAEKKRFGRLTVAQVLEKSSNIAMVKIIQQMQPSTYYGWLERIGLRQKSEIDLPSEPLSRLKSQEEFISSPIEPAAASFGQGFSLTAMQLVQMHGALANGGKLVTPHLVTGLIDNKGQIHQEPNLSPPRQIFSPITAQRVVEMMETVVAKGTGKPASIPDYRIAGKTGTAEKASKQGGYLEDEKITSFVGILPVEAPRYVVLALVDEPKGANTYGSTVAAPIVKQVMEALIRLEQIPPSSK